MKQVEETYFCSSKFITGAVTIIDGKITETPPVWKKHIGKDFHQFQKDCWIDRIERICVNS